MFILLVAILHGVVRIPFCLTCDSFSCSAFLKEYKNEDVAVGSWMLGLDTEHIDDRSLCCAFSTGIFSSGGHSFGRD